MRILTWLRPNTISRYLLRAHVGPFLFSLSTIIFLFLLQFVMKFIDQLVGKGLSAWVIIELVGLNLAWMVVLAVPMSVLVATLMAFGELSSRNEITAMKAGGIGIFRMIAPVLFAALLVAILLVFFNNDVLPEANHRLRTLTSDIRRKKPTFALVPGLFSQDVSGYSILVRKTFEKSNDLEGVTIYDYTNPSMSVVVTAETGTISFSPDYRKLIMDLRNGEIHELDLQKTSSYRKIRFHQHRIAMDVEGFDFARTAEGTFARGDRELSAQAMQIIVDSLGALRTEGMMRLHKIMQREMEHYLSGTPAQFGAEQFRYRPGISVPELALNRVRSLHAAVQNELNATSFLERTIDQYNVEIHKKYSIPFACLVFVFIGVPLGIMARRGGFGVAATLSLGFFVLYWAFLVGGEKLADRTITTAFWGMWSANILLSIMGAYLTIRIGKETVVINWSFFQRFLPRRWQTSIKDDHVVDAA